MHTTFPVTDNPAVLLMCSGGSDSMYLLSELLNRYQDKYIHVMYVNHGISKNAEQWGKFIKEQLPDNEKVIFHNHKIRWSKGENKTETSCRNKRYDAVEKYCQKHGINTVFTGHHADDVLENQFISVFRNRQHHFSIPQEIEKNGITYFRPLIKLEKRIILKYCELHNIPFVEDESNFESNNIRNIIRNGLITPIRNNIPDNETQHYLNGAKAFFRDYQLMREDMDQQLSHFSNILLKSITEKDGKNIYSISLDCFFTPYGQVACIAHFLKNIKQYPISHLETNRLFQLVEKGVKPNVLLKINEQFFVQFVNNSLRIIETK